MKVPFLSNRYWPQSLAQIPMKNENYNKNKKFKSNHEDYDENSQQNSNDYRPMCSALRIENLLNNENFYATSNNPTSAIYSTQPQQNNSYLYS